MCYFCPESVTYINQVAYYITDLYHIAAKSVESYPNPPSLFYIISGTSIFGMKIHLAPLSSINSYFYYRSFIIYGMYYP